MQISNIEKPHLQTLILLKIPQGGLCLFLIFLPLHYFTSFTVHLEWWKIRNPCLNRCTRTNTINSIAHLAYVQVRIYEGGFHGPCAYVSPCRVYIGLDLGSDFSTLILWAGPSPAWNIQQREGTDMFWKSGWAWALPLVLWAGPGPQYLAY